MRMIARFCIALLACACLQTQAEPAATPAPAAVVTAFCDAITSRDINKALALLAPGSVQFTLRPSHTGIGGQAPALTSDLRAHWSTVGPVLVSATRSYSRSAEILDSRIEGEIATVWARTRTRTVRSDAPNGRTDEFTELYVLVLKEGKWLIGGVADTRRPNDVGLGAPAR